MKKWLLFRTYINSPDAIDRFNYLAKKLSSDVHLVWLFDADYPTPCHYDGSMPSNCSQFGNSDQSIRNLWPLIFDTYDSVPGNTPRMFASNGEKFSLKWSLGHLCLLEWWKSVHQPEGRFITWEHDIWWDRDFNPVKALAPAFRHKKFLTPMVKPRNTAEDSPQPPVRNAPKWFKECMICHDCMTARSSNLFYALDQFSNHGAWGQVEVITPSVADTHPNGGKSASWSKVAMDACLQPLIHRFSGQRSRKSPQRLFKL